MSGSTRVYSEGGYVLFWSQNDKTSNIWCESCFRHDNICAKAGCRMMVATTFSCQNDAGSLLSVTYGKISVVGCSHP